MNIVGFAGSLRRASWNTALLQNAAKLMPEGADLHILSIDDIPLYSEDVEAEGIPDAVVVLKDRIADADGLVIATPEYNGGIPGVAKNVIDWASRPMADQARVLLGKPVALMGATPGAMGTAFSQSAWTQVLRTLRMSLYTRGGSMMLSRAYEQFDADGNLTDEKLRERLREFVDGFVDWVGRA